MTDVETKQRQNYGRYERRMVAARKQPLSYEVWLRLTALEAALPPTRKSTYA